MSQTSAYIGKGKVYLATGNNPLVAIGNVSKLVLNVSEDKQELMDYENGGGGVIDSVSRIKSVSAAITANSFSSSNLAVALRGIVTTNLSTTAIVDETHQGVEAGLIQLARLPDSTKAMVVAVGATTCVDGVDYVRTKSGIEVLADGAISGTSAITVNYTPLAENVLQALVAGATNYRMLFEGLNEAKSGAPFVVELFKVQISPTKSLDLISDKFGDITLEGTALKDDSKMGTGLSQYFKIRQAIA